MSLQEILKQTNIWEPLRENEDRNLILLLSSLKTSLVLLNSFFFKAQSILLNHLLFLQ